MKRREETIASSHHRDTCVAPKEVRIVNTRALLFVEVRRREGYQLFYFEF
jgi:hypothetical protein